MPARSLTQSTFVSVEHNLSVREYIVVPGLHTLKPRKVAMCRSGFSFNESLNTAVPVPWQKALYWRCQASPLVDSIATAVLA